MKFFHLRSFLYICATLVIFFSILQGCKTGKGSHYTGLRDEARGFTIVGSYNRKHDALFDDYRILNIAFVNNSPRPVKMDPEKDIWMIYDSRGRSYQAINSLEYNNPNVWYSIPYEAQIVLSYPKVVLINETVSFAIFFPRGLDLIDFRRISYYCADLDAEISGSKTMGNELNKEE